MDYLPIIIILATAGLVQGSIGFGYGLMAIPLLALYLPIPQAALTSLLMSSLITLILVVTYRGSIHFRHFRWLWITIIIGALAPAVIAVNVTEFQLDMLLNIVIITFGLIMLFKPSFKIKNSLTTQSLFGFFSGVLNSLIGTNGPPLAIYFESTGVKHKEFLGTISLILLTVNITSIAVISESFKAEYLPPQVLLIAAIAVLVMSYIGSKLTHNIHEKTFKHLILIVILAIGAVRFGQMVI